VRRDDLRRLMASNGFIAADEEADELLAAADGDEGRLAAMLERRLTGEPLAWVTGTIVFCELEIHVAPGVFVPRWQCEPLAYRAAERLPPGGIAVDVCTGSGAIARVMAEHRPDARVVGADIDDAAVACARSNGVEAHAGDLFDPIPGELLGAVDVVTAVVPYVPTDELWLLQRDTFTFETPLAYDGGRDGGDILRRVLAESPALLRPGGALLMGLGGKQHELLAPQLERFGFTDVRVLRDEEDDVRGIETIYTQDG
jgi:release factor glutamine methyltransferase